ncbi:MAG: uracil-DNA glycosylase [Acidobacteriota bacterium]|nr:uracil-DNA glycosylase [Acidobacteriota bacterium]
MVHCTRCPRLVQYCRAVAEEKRRAFRGEVYWGKPVPSFGDPAARLLIVGLAPAAHGGNRTGRAFTGDRSGDLLYKVLHQTGFANQPHSRDARDDLRLTGAWISQVIHCAPPGNKPLPEEIRNCRYWLRRELDALSDLRVVVALGKIAFDGYLAALKELGELNRGMLFGHNALNLTGVAHPPLISSYHPSQQNTSTGRLTERMFLDVFMAARKACDETRDVSLQPQT